MSKGDSSLIHSPVDDLVGNPKERQPGAGTWNGEPGLPGRTPSPNAVAEKTYDETPGLSKKS